MNSQSNRILVIRLSGMGDVVMTLPVIEQIRERQGDVEIGYVTDLRWQGLLENSGLVDRVHYLDRQAIKQGTFSTRWSIIRALVREIRAHKYQRALDMQSFGETSLLAWLSGASQRVGWCKHGSHRLWINQPVEGMDGQQHRTGFFFQFADGQAGITPPQLKRPPLLKGFPDHTKDPQKVALFIGASQPVRRWPIESFAELADILNGKGYQVSLLAGPAEQQVVDWLTAHRSDLSVIRFDSMPALIDRLSGAGHLVSGDTGPIHVGGALGVPHIVGLYQDHNLQHSTPMYSDTLQVLHDTDVANISVSSAAATFNN